jgi:membrane-associated phospholipid phosphatase
MLHPKTSALVIADAPRAGGANTELPLQSLKMLVDGARLLQVPIFFVRYPRSASPGILATTLDEWVLSAETLFDPAMLKWTETELGAAIVTCMRTHIICAGLWLEEAVTLLTLKALSIGMDAFVPVDAVAAINSSNHLAAHARLMQAGAVPTTSEQILREWAALSGDQNIHANITAILAN